MKLGIGTAQFGMNYGISNKAGQTPEAEVERILAAAAASGVSALDTAAMYGESERVLGRLLPQQHRFRITTKLPALLGEGRVFDMDAADRLLEQALHNLRQQSIHGLMLHRPDELLSVSGDRLMHWLESCRSTGVATRIGVSVYEETQLERLFSRYPSLDLIQAPVNLFDQRLVRSGALQRFKALGTEIHVRSVFLQGLLLMAPREVPAYFAPYGSHFRRYHLFLRRMGLNALEAALAFVRDREEIDSVICGVNDLRQLQDLITCMRAPACPFTADYALLAASEPGLLNPSLWQV